MALVVGLGNPGPSYRGTRHNAGFLVLDELARRWGASFSSDRVAERARSGDHRLLKPLTFMNVSGRAVQADMSRHGISPADLVVVHDDLDLPLGRLRLKHGGGAGGQKGVKDIAERIGPDFHRVKVGIGRPPERWTVENWVLSRFREDERPLVDDVVAAAADAVEMLLAEGLEPAMNRYNGLDLRDPPEPPPNDDAAAPASAGTEDASADTAAPDGPAVDDQPNRPEM